VQSVKSHWQFLGLVTALFVLQGCETTTVEEVVPEPTPYDRANLVFEETGFIDNRTGWWFPQVFDGEWVANQAWEFEKTVIGIDYVSSGSLLQISTEPVSVDPSLIEAGTVSILAYPVDYTLDGGPRDSFMGTTADLLGIGHLQHDGEAEFWAYQEQLEEMGYNLWKLVKLQVPEAPDRVFHSLLVLKKLSEDKSEGLVVTVGQASDCYVLIVMRRYVRSKDDVAQFGEWAYDILQGLNLRAIGD
jgi:hypothetical protein